MNIGYPKFLEIKEMELSKKNVISKLNSIKKSKNIKELTNNLNQIIDLEVENTHIEKLRKNLYQTPTIKIIDFLNSKLHDKTRNETMYSMISTIMKGNKKDIDKLLENVSPVEKKELEKSIKHFQEIYSKGEKKIKESLKVLDSSKNSERKVLEQEISEIRSFINYADYFNVKDSIKIELEPEEKVQEINSKYFDFLKNNSVVFGELRDIIIRNSKPNVKEIFDDNFVKFYNGKNIMDYLALLSFNQTNAKYDTLNFLRSSVRIDIDSLGENLKKNVNLQDDRNKDLVKFKKLNNITENFGDDKKQFTDIKGRFYNEKSKEKINKTFKTLKGIMLNNHLKGNELQETVLKITNLFKEFAKKENITIKDFIESRESIVRKEFTPINEREIYYSQESEKNRNQLNYSKSNFKRLEEKEKRNIQNASETILSQYEYMSKDRHKNIIKSINNPQFNKIQYLEFIKSSFLFIIKNKEKEIIEERKRTSSTKTIITLSTIVKELKRDLGFDINEEYVKLVSTNNIEEIKQNSLMLIIQNNELNQSLDKIKSLLSIRTNVKDFNSNTIPYKNTVSLNENSRNLTTHICSLMKNLQLNEYTDIDNFKMKIEEINDELKLFKRFNYKTSRNYDMKELFNKFESFNNDMEEIFGNAVKKEEETLTEKIKKTNKIIQSFNF